MDCFFWLAPSGRRSCLFCLRFCLPGLLAWPGCSFYPLSLSLVVCLTLMVTASGWSHAELDLSPPVHQARWKCLCLVVVVVVPVVGVPPVRCASLRAQVFASLSVSGPVYLFCFSFRFVCCGLLSVSLAARGLSSTSYCLCFVLLLFVLAVV